jgi:hypothetical protein
MAQNTVYQWPVQNLQAVCKTQDVDAGDNLVLNGTMSVSGVAQISFIRSGFSRSVSISSTDDLSGATFTVTGIQNGAGIIKNNITGPNNNTIYTDEIFDAITSVTVDSNVTHVQVGTGDTGFLPLLNADPTFSRFNIRHTNGSYALSVIPSIGAGITYTVWTTLENISNNGVPNGIPFVNQTNRFFPLSESLEDATTKQLYQTTNLTNYLLLQVTASTTPDTDSLDLIVMQS